ncbi:MAG: ribosome-associated translation inhibitor RaiA [Acidithiobacillus sp.]|nr:ribosome-associated translation inhibitor RaiA [Acidithiobacillus sp.]
MQLHLTGHHMDLTEALKDHVQQKLSRIDHYFDRVIDAKVILRHLSHENPANQAEVTIIVPGHEFHAEARDPDMYAAIDMVVEKIDGQLRQFKDKLHKHRAESMGAVLIAEAE